MPVRELQTNKCRMFSLLDLKHQSQRGVALYGDSHKQSIHWDKCLSIGE